MIYGTKEEAQETADWDNRYKPLTEQEQALGYPDCKTCGNNRNIYVPDYVKDGSYWNGGYWREISYRCRCNQIISTLQIISRSGLKNLLQNYRLDNFETKEPWQKNIRDTAISFGKSIKAGGYSWLLVLGESGSGKTHLCTGVCGALLKYGFSIKYFRWGVEGKRIKALINTSDYADEVDKIMAFDIIYIDDLFKRRKGATVTDGDIKLAFELIDTILAERKILIVSGEDDFMQLYDIDAAIAGRLKQNAGEFMAQISGGDKNQRL